MAPLPQPFGRYTLHRKIGEGGMAEVYAATIAVGEGLAKRLVVKKIRRDCADQTEYARMFVDEAKIALGLNHANIVQVFDFGQIDGDLYLAMELVEGVDLMRLIHTVHAGGDRIPPVIAAYIAHQVSAGLAYAHSKRDDFEAPLGIVHRDISPHNIMISFAGTVKVLDFGIARPAPSPGVIPRHRLPYPTDVLEDMTIQGKVAYMAPEQAMGRRVDPRADIYALGVVLYEMLSGALVFRGKSPSELLEEVRSQPLPPLASVAPDLPPPLVAAVDRALARDPEARWATARALQSALASYLHRADPVVDDETLSAFVTRYHPLTPVAAAELVVADHDATREFKETERALPLAARREHATPILLHAALVATTPTAIDRGRFLVLAREIAFKRGAQLLRADDHALCLAFGALPAAEEPAEQALRVALALREAIGDAAPGLGIGVALGTAPATIHRIAGAPLIIEPEAAAAAILAASAERAVDGPVMIVGEPPESLRERWRLGPPVLSTTASPPETPLLGPLRLGDPRIHHAPGIRAALFGRELELRTLREAFVTAIRARVARAVVITGAAGLGKRTLVERFVGGLPRGSAAVLRVSGQWRRRNVSLGALLRLLEAPLDLATATSTDDLEARLAALGVADPRVSAAALAEPLGLPGAPRLPPGGRREILHRLVDRLLASLAETRPVLVIVEAAHDIDDHSLALFADFLGAAPRLPILFVLSARPSPRLTALRALPGVADLSLGELDERARRDLIVRRFADPAAAEPLAAAILARTAGNPLYIEETLALLLHRGILAWDPHHRLLELRQRDAVIEVPPSVEAALHARLDALPPGAREVASAAAILGQSFRPDEVAALIGRAVDHELELLRDLGIFEADPDNHPLRFASISLHELCRRAIAADLARELHTRAVAIRRGRADYRPGGDDGPIAEHLLEAGRPAAAVEPALRAATAALAIGGSREAHYFFSLALKGLPPGDPRRFAILGEREAILRSWGRRRLQGADLRQMIDLAHSPEEEVWASLRLLRFYLECGRIQHAEALIPRLRARIAGLAAPLAAQMTLGELRADLLQSRGDLAGAEAAARAALVSPAPPENSADDPTADPAASDADRLHRARLHLRIGRAQLGRGELTGAQETLTAVLETARGVDDRRLAAEALTHLGEVAGRQTRYQRAIDCLLEALAIDRELGDRRATGTKLANLGILYTAIGLYRRAERYLRKALDLHEALGDTGLLGDVVVHLGEVMAELGDRDAARSLLADATAIARARGDLRTELRAQARLAGVLFDEASHGAATSSAAAALAAQVLERARASTLRTAQARALHVQSRIAALGGDLQGAIAAEREAVALIDAGAAPVDGVLAIYHLGQLLSGEAGEAGGSGTRSPEARAEGRALLARAAALTQARLDDLRDPELRSSYLAQPMVQALLRERGEFAQNSAESGASARSRHDSDLEHASDPPPCEAE